MRLRRQVMGGLAIVCVLTAGRELVRQSFERTEIADSLLAAEKAQVPAEPGSPAGENQSLEVPVADNFTAKEKAIEAALQTPQTYQFSETPLNEVLAQLAKQGGVPIVVDEVRIDDEGIGLRELISTAGTDVPLVTAIERILTPIQLDWVIRHETLFITTNTYADELLETRIYGVQDLLDLGYDYDELIDMLSSTVAPDSWDVAGSTRPGVGVLATRQTQRLHRQILTFLTDLKRIARVQGQLPKDANARERRISKTYRTYRFAAKQIVDVIERTIEPKTWIKNGGSGEIYPLEATQTRPSDQPVAGAGGGLGVWNVDLGEAIVVTHTHRVQSEIQKMMKTLIDPPYVRGMGGGTGMPAPTTPAPPTK